MKTKMNPGGVNAAVLLWRRLRRRPALLAVAAGAPAFLLVAFIVYALASRDLVAEIRAEIESGNPRRARAAVVLLGSLLEQGKLGKGEERKRGLAVARAVIARRDSDAECVQAAARLLAGAADREAVPVLLACAGDRHRPLPARLSALRAAAAIGENDRSRAGRTAKDLGRLLADRDEKAELRAAAAAALPSFWCREARLALQRVAADGHAPEAVRVAAVRALGGKVSLQSPAMAFLLGLQADVNEAVVRAAEAALSRARTRASIFDLYGIRNHVSAAVRGAAEIERMNAERQRRLMALADDPLGERRRERQRDKKNRPAAKILPRLEAPEAATRMGAAYDLGVLADPLAVPSLVKHLADADARVSLGAARALARIAAEHPKAGIDLKTVRGLLTGSDPGRRAAAAYLLGRLEDGKSAPPLAAALAREKDLRAILTMIDALARIRGKQALAAIASCLRTHRDDPDVATRCVRALVRFGPAGLPAIRIASHSVSPRVRKAANAALH